MWSEARGRSVLVGCALLVACARPRVDSPLTSPRLEGYFPDVVLRAHDGRHVRFYRDVLRNKIAVINFMYTRCTRKCPRVSANLVRVQRALGARVGRDVVLVSIS